MVNCPDIFPIPNGFKQGDAFVIAFFNFIIFKVQDRRNWDTSVMLIKFLLNHKEMKCVLIYRNQNTAQNCDNRVGSKIL